MKFDWKKFVLQLAVALALFLAGYFTFNGGLFPSSAPQTLTP